MTIFHSKRIWFALAILIGLVFLKVHPILIASSIFGCAYLFNTKTINPLKNYKFWIIIVILIIIVPLFTGLQDRVLFRIQYSSDQLNAMILMTLRGISVFILFQVLTVELNVDRIKPLLSMVGIKQFDVIYNLSNDTLPKIKSIIASRYNYFRVNWKRKKSLELILAFITDIFIDIFHLSDQLSSSNSGYNKLTPQEFYENSEGFNSPHLIVLVGETDSGKPAWVEQFIKILQNNDQTIDGIISIKTNISTTKWQHDLVRISTDELHQLTTMDEIETEISVGKFYFYRDIIDWGNAQLKSINNTDWIVVDEVGLLEFDGGGFLQGLQYLSEQFTGNLVITLRFVLRYQLDDFIEKNLPKLKDWERSIISL